MSQERLMQVLLEPRVTEKSTQLADSNNQFTFRVTSDATKSEVKGAVELLFEVQVESVQLMNVKGKTKRFGQRQGKRSDWKKAYVKLKEGFDIDFMGAQ